MNNFRASIFSRAMESGVEVGVISDRWAVLLDQPSLLWAPKGGPVSSRSSGSRSRSELKEKISVPNKILVLGDFRMQDVIAKRFRAPLDLETFGRFCEFEYSEENLAFLLLVRRFKRHPPKQDSVVGVAARIAKEYIAAGGHSEINLSDEIRTETVSRAKRMDAKSPDLALFDGAYQAVVKLMERDVFRRFKNMAVLQARITEAQAMALWCWNPDETPDCASFFSYPNPVDAVHARLHHLFAALFTAIGMSLYALESFDHALIWFYFMLYGFVARTACGPRLDPMSYVVLFVIDPIVRKIGLMHTRYVKNKSRRFAEVGGGINTAILIVAALYRIDALVYIISAALIVGAGLHVVSGKRLLLLLIFRVFYSSLY